MSKEQKKNTKLPLSKANKIIFTIAAIVVFVVLYFYWRIQKYNEEPYHERLMKEETKYSGHPLEAIVNRNKWLVRAYAVGELFHSVYTPCWEGAYGAMGDAYLFKATNDSSLLRFHLEKNDLRNMCEGTWVDDRAWVCLAELLWWDVTGRKHFSFVEDAKRRYLEARNEGRLSHHEGYWTWYNWPPQMRINERIFSNSNMNQMVAVACWLYEATNEQRFLDDALLVWNGDKQFPGIEQVLYKGNGRWEGKAGLAAFGKELPWNGTEYCSIGAMMYRITNDEKYKRIVVETAQHIVNPQTHWIDAQYCYQIRMDGNGAFVHFLLDAYSVAPNELQKVLPIVETMLEHVWTNNDGMARVTLHRESDNGIRNGWNPLGGEDGYNVDEIGTVHAQGEAMRAFGVFAYYWSKKK